MTKQSAAYINLIEMVKNSKKKSRSLNSTPESFECRRVLSPLSCASPLGGAGINHPLHQQHPMSGIRCYPSTLRSYSKWAPTEQGATLVWRDLCVYASGKGCGPGGRKSIKRIIGNVSGAVTPGTLIALMGSSGAGKSTLMSALAFRTQRRKPYKCVCSVSDLLFLFQLELLCKGASWSTGILLGRICTA